MKAKVFELIAIVSLTLLLLASTGCASMPKYVDQVKQVRDAINNLLPSDFKGDVDTGRNDAWFDISLKAGNLHKNDKGEWTWDWVDYSRLTHIAAIGPAGWTSNVHVKLGKKP